MHFMKENALLKEQVKCLLEKGVLVSPDMIERLRANPDGLNFLASGQQVVVLDSGAEQLIKAGEGSVNWQELERTKVLYEKDLDSKGYGKVMGLLQKKTVMKGCVNVVSSYAEPSRKYGVKDFVSLFNARYKGILPFIAERPDMAHIVSISRAKQRPARERTSVVAMVFDKQVTKNNNIVLLLEDGTGALKAMALKSPAKESAAGLVPDEVAGFSGVMSRDVFMVDRIILPDIPNKELKTSPEPGYAIFLSDLHVGSVNFLEDDFNRFIEWINQRSGSQEQRAIASQVKYIFVAGDLVDGVGIYPEQDKELIIKDIYAQYSRCAELLAKIPEDIQIVVCPGNHDATRIAEPQPAFYQDFTRPVSELKNVVCVSNPALVNIDACPGFQGFNVLLYHGYSFDHYVANVDAIRISGGYDRADLIMRFLIQRRHLAPVHSSTLYIPDSLRDPLVIDCVPDFFVTGHIHKSSLSHYKNTTLVCGSCWQSKTAFQERVGHHPEPARVPVVDLRTRKVKILRFGK